jgi:hypothetical protein
LALIKIPAKKAEMMIKAQLLKWTGRFGAPSLFGRLNIRIFHGKFTSELDRL